MVHKSDNPKSVCFSAVLRRLLCSGGSPTHPADNISDSYRSKNLPEPKTEQTPGRESPNLVARLMGLDSLPEENWVWSETTPRSVTRSKSVNFMEYLLNYKDNNEEEGTLFRNVKASVSFRESPCSARNQRKHELLMMYLDKLDEKCESELKSKVSERGFKELVQKKTERSKNRDLDKTETELKMCNKKVLRLKDEPRKVCKNKKHEIGGKKDVKFNKSSAKSSVIAAKSPVIAAKNRRKRMNSKEEEAESSSEGSNPSPVSVLAFDLQECKTHYDCSSPGDSVSTRLDSESDSTEYTANLMRILAKLSEKDMKETTWYSKQDLRFEDLEELCKGFEEEMVDQILDQLVEELVCK